MAVKGLGAASGSVPNHRVLNDTVREVSVHVCPVSVLSLKHVVLVIVTVRSKE